ncbi:hypothetical protein GAPWKB11_1953 [Gilliamella apicola]|nr:hypothetical protein GAPWKB11_1953 [Gilliamella apicola]
MGMKITLFLHNLQYLIKLNLLKFKISLVSHVFLGCCF